MPINPDLENSLTPAPDLENLVDELVPLDISEEESSSWRRSAVALSIAGLGLAACAPTTLETQVEESAPTILIPTTEPTLEATKILAVSSPTIEPTPTSVLTLEPSPMPKPTEVLPTPILVEPTPTLRQMLPTPTIEPTPISKPTATDQPKTWVEVDISEQKLIFYGDGDEVREFLVSTGLPQTPTVEGTYNIERLYESCNMRGLGYFTEGVPYCMFFYEGYALHGAWWHNNFGHQMSHGCVNLRPEDAGWIFERVGVGTKVIIHE